MAISATAPALRNAALLLQAEAAYAAGDYAAAEAAYARLLSEAPQHPQASLLRLSLAWTALRRDQRDEARRRFLEFAAQYPARCAPSGCARARVGAGPARARSRRRRARSSIG